MRLHDVVPVFLALALLIRGSAVAAESDLAVPTTDGPVAVKMFTVSGEARRPTVLILQGRAGIAAFAAYARYADDLADAGIDAWLFSYYSATDDEVMRSPGCESHIALYEARFRAWDLSFWRTPERLPDEPDELVTWAREALAAARRVAAKRERIAPRRKSKPQPT